MLGRLRFLTRLSRRYAVRHKGQTIRAVLGLLVATTVLATGLGMGESIAVSLEEAALAQFGPIDIILTSERPFDASIADALPGRAGLRNVSGAATLGVAGSVLHPAGQKAEPFASIRGVSPQEAATLGPLAGSREPGAGEVVISERLASRLDAKVGDRLRLRVPNPSLSDLETTLIVLAGATTPLGVGAPHTLEVSADAIGLGAEIGWQGTGTVTIEAIAPSGVSFANASASQPLRLEVPAPLEEGTWTFVVRSALPVAYAGGAGAVYLPPDLATKAVTLDAQLVGIAKDEGRAAITARPTALVPLADLQRALGSAGEATHAYYRATGDPYAAVAALEAALPPENASLFEIRAEKADRIADAQESGAEITGFLIVMGGFTLLAAALLAFTLFSALVEERRAELGIMRALGLTRGEVALSMTVEGALYAAAAALAGLLLGLALLWGVLSGIQAFAPEEAPDFALRVSGATLVVAFVLGSLIPLVTIALASLRFARLDPARAIRGIPDDPKARRRVGLVSGLVLLGAGGLFSIGEVGWLVGIPLALVGLALTLVAFRRPRLAILPGVAAFAHIGWSLYAWNTWPEDAGEVDPILTLSRGALLALGLSALAVASARPFALLARRSSRPAFLASRYIVARRRPVGLTIAMVALVVVIVTVMGTLFSVFGATIPEEEAGYSVLGESPIPLDGLPRAPPPELARSIERFDVVPRHTGFRQADITRDGVALNFTAGSRQYLGATSGFAEANEYELEDRASVYASDEAAWEAVVRGEAILFPDWALELNNVSGGDVITLRTASTPARDYVVAGGVRSDWMFQTWIAADHVRAMGFTQSTSVFVRVVDGADPDDVAHRLAAFYAEDGMSFTSIPEEVAFIMQSVQAIVLVFEGFLALGVFVGLAATGFLAARAVHERMRDIGTLRALGYEETDVRRAFMLESTLTAALGLIIGTAVGVLVAHSIWWREIRPDVPFRPPVPLLVVFAALVLVLAALASRGPAKRAAALPPAIAVRHVE